MLGRETKDGGTSARRTYTVTVKALEETPLPLSVVADDGSAVAVEGVAVGSGWLMDGRLCRLGR
ncbi:hypothetical protein GCM10020220_095170 [Nonomuraea rubra]